MKPFVFFQSLVIVFGGSLILQPKTWAQSSASPTQTSGKVLARSLPPGSQLSTDVRFDPSNVYGRYNSAGEAVATVEDDKMMGPLLGLRMHFKDRLQNQVEQR